MDEWKHSMAKPGGQGGCKATEIERYEDSAETDRRQVIDVPGTEGMEPPLLRICVADELPKIFAKMKYMRAVPKGRAAKELYQMLMESDPG